MPTFEFTSPEGKTYSIEGPQGATKDQAFAILQQQLGGSKPMAEVTPISTDPTGSFGQNFAAGAGKFVADTGRGAQSLLNDTAVALENALPSSVTNAVNKAGAFLGMRPAKQIQTEGVEAINESRKLDAPLMSTAGGNLGYIAGGVSTAPIMPAVNTVKGAAGLGAVLGITQPATSWEERAKNTAVGGVAGGVGQGIVKGVSRVVSPNTSPEVRALMNEGVTPTPGQILGGSVKRTEEAMTSIPIIGDAIKSGQRRAASDLNNAAMNRALSPIKESLPKGISGRDAVEYVGDKLGAKYESLLPKLTAKADKTFSQEIAQLRSMVDNGAIDPRAAESFKRILQNDVLGKFQAQGSMTGQTLKQVESDLGQQISRLSASTDADQRLIADALKEVQSSLRGVVQRSNPAQAAELKAINTGYANFKRVQRAASGLGADEGIFSAAQLQSAVKAMDRSKDKGQFAKGGALMQDLSEPAKSVLGNTVPDSGTPYRTLTAMGAGGLASLLSPAAAAGIMTAPVMYSKAGQNALATLLARRPESASRIADLIRLSGPGVALGGSAFAVQQ